MDLQTLRPADTPDAAMQVGSVRLTSPLVVSPMAGMTDTAFRRLVKRQGGCGLVVSEMVSSEGLVRGSDRTLEYAEYTEEERPVSIQIYGGDPASMAEAARVVEGMGADIVDVNMGCPVRKVSRHNAGCSLMSDPEHAAKIIAAMRAAVSIPVTVKMRKGMDDNSLTAPEVAKRVEDAGAAAITIHGRTAKQSYTGFSDWDFITSVAATVKIPVFGSGDCVTPEQVVERLRSGVSGVFVGRGVLRNPWILAQTQDLLMGLPKRTITQDDLRQFLLDYVELLLGKGKHEAIGFRHVAPQAPDAADSADPQRSRPVDAPARGHERRVINQLRALCGWYAKGLPGGSQGRPAVNTAETIPQLRAIIAGSFRVGAEGRHESGLGEIDRAIGSGGVRPIEASDTVYQDHFGRNRPVRS